MSKLQKKWNIIDRLKRDEGARSLAKKHNTGSYAISGIQNRGSRFLDFRNKDNIRSRKSLQFATDVKLDLAICMYKWISQKRIKHKIRCEIPELKIVEEKLSVDHSAAKQFVKVFANGGEKLWFGSHLKLWWNRYFLENVTAQNAYIKIWTYSIRT